LASCKSKKELQKSTLIDTTTTLKNNINNIKKTSIIVFIF